MRVLYCTDTYVPQVNGVSVVTAISAAGLGRLGWECAVVAPRYPAETNGHTIAIPDADTVPRIEIPSFALPNYPEVRLAAPRLSEVTRAVARFRPDIVHCATEFVIGRMGQRAGLRAGLPIVSSYHTDFGRYAEAYGARWLRGAVTSYLGRFHRRSRRIYTPSAAACEDLARFGVDRVEVWGRGVDIDTFHPGRRSPEMRAMYGMGSRFNFVYVGRLAKEKRVDLIVRAFAMASERVPRGVLHLTIAGAGPCEAELRAMAPPGVTFMGYLDRRGALPDLYANCDAFVFASTTETLGLVVLEAMASGVPVIAAPAGGVAEHLRDGVNGLAYPPFDAASMADAMGMLAAAAAMTRKLGRGARQTAEALGWDAEVRRLDQSYREVIAGDGSSGNQQRIVVPSPSSLSAETRPPCASTKCLTMASPSPVPPSSRERDGSAR
jgi:phosphatidylinositol alpha 1,6-mannosyltransferase